TVKGGVIKTSSGGGPPTLGVNSQMFDSDDGTGGREGADFTYVKKPDPKFLASATTHPSPTQANDADNILYTGGTNTATTASTSIVQTQGSANVPVAMKITAYDIADSPQARDFVNGLGTGTPVNITSVKVNGVAVIFTTEGNGVIGSGLKDGDTGEWTTSAPHDPVLIESATRKFDIGVFPNRKTA